MTLEEFLSRVDRSGGPTSCHRWTGSIGSTGYGTVRIDGRVRNAHAVAYEHAHGACPSGMVVRHMCAERSSARIAGGPHAERACCNPAHLEAGTPRENADDRTRAGRSFRKHRTNPDRRYW